jgi:hypothetical protein
MRTPMNVTVRRTPLVKLFDAGSSAELGTITDAQLQFMIDQLEEESDDDQDYYINADTIDLFEQAGADAGLVELLRRALGSRPDMDVRWERT